MTLDQLRQKVLRECKPYRGSKGFGLRRWCEANGVAQTHASDFMAGKRGPAADLLEALGLEWRIVRKPARAPLLANNSGGPR